MSGSWIVVACAEHARLGRAQGIVQACHGKAGPLRSMQPGDRVAVYSPTTELRGGDRLQAFTALGEVADGPVWSATLPNGFRPHRRSVRWRDARPAPVGPLRERPGFALAGAGWGAKLRCGLLAIDAASMDAIAAAMTS